MKRRVPAIVLAGSIALIGCGEGGDRRRDVTGASTEPLPAPKLPDLSGMSDSVRQQLLDGHRSFTEAVGNPAASPPQKADAFGQLGGLMLAARFNAEAETCYHHAQTLAPGDFRWPYSLGHVYLALGDRPKAAASFVRALELKSSDLPALIWLGETYLDEGHPGQAGPTFEKALSVDPNSAAAAFGAGRAALTRQAYADAVKYLQRALALDPRASAVHYPLGMAYRALGDVTRADGELRQRGTAFPQFADPFRPGSTDLLRSAIVYENEGIQALKEGNWTAAAAAFRQGLELRPDDPALRHRLASALYASGDVTGATREFEILVQRSPAFVKGQVSLGVILNLNGRYREAIDRFTAAVKADPNFPEGHLGLAEARRMSGQLEASLAEYERAITLDPAIAESWIGGAQALIGLGRRQAALEWIARARKVHPTRRELAELQARIGSLQ
jgi:tetratricopeptide (TPR) repeat protein